MGSESVKVLGLWASPYAMRAKIALNLKGVEFESQEENLFAKSELLLKSNPVYAKVPVLLHGDRTICESLIIIQYVDQVWSHSGHQIMPSDPYDLAIQRFWAAYIDETWFPEVRGINFAYGNKAVIGERYPKAAAGLALLEEAFVKCSKGGKFFGGETIGYLDIALGTKLGWVKVAEIMGDVTLFDEVKNPHLFEWAQRFRHDDAVKDVFPDFDKLLHFANFLADKLEPILLPQGNH